MIAPEPFFQPRGTPLSVLHRLRALSELGYTVDLVTYPLGQDVEIEQVRIHRSWKPPLVRNVKAGPSYTKLLLDFFLFIKATRMLMSGRYEVLHTHEEAAFFAALLARAFKVKHIYDMHSSLPQQLRNFSFTRSRLLIRIFSLLERLTIRNCSAVIVICRELEEYVRKIASVNVVLIENTPDYHDLFRAEQPPDEPAELRQRLGLDGSPVVLYAGTFEPYQGLELLVDSARIALQSRPELRFVLVGGKPHQVEKLKARVSALGLADKFLFAGEVSPSQVRSYLELASILVSPRTEGINTPLKLYSYLRSGKPILATNVISHTQVLNQEVALLRAPDCRDFAEGILMLLDNPALCERLARNAKEMAALKYSYHDYLAKTRLIYEEVASRGLAATLA